MALLAFRRAYSVKKRCYRHQHNNINGFIICCSRLYQLAKLYLFAPSSGIYGCPLAMADGAVKSIEVCTEYQYIILFLHTMKVAIITVQKRAYCVS
jgi:hypothetical protein